MTGTLTDKEIDALLYGQFVGRVGCHAQGTTYVVPVAYAYDGAAIYGYSPDGMKLEMMSHNPDVCFEIDRVESPGNWVSVIAWGTFQPLDGEEARLAIDRLSSRLRAAASSGGAAASYVTRSGVYGLAWRILLERRTGRFERAD